MPTSTWPLSLFQCCIKSFHQNELSQTITKAPYYLNGLKSLNIRILNIIPNICHSNPCAGSLILFVKFSRFFGFLLHLLLVSKRTLEPLFASIQTEVSFHTYVFLSLHRKTWRNRTFALLANSQNPGVKRKIQFHLPLLCKLYLKYIKSYFNNNLYYKFHKLESFPEVSGGWKIYILFWK